MTLKLKVGDNVFYCDNGPNNQKYGAIAIDVIKNLELVPLVYMAAGTTVEQTSLRPEITEDFFSSTIAFVRLVGTNPDDNWVMLHTGGAEKRGIPIVNYAPTIHPSIPTKIVTSVQEFESILRKDLKDMLS